MKIENLKLENQKLKRHVHELTILNELARLINSTMPVEKILNRVLSVALKAVRAEQGYIAILDEKIPDTGFKTMIRMAEQTNFRVNYRLNEILTGWIIKNKKPLRINSIENELPVSLPQDTHLTHQFKSLLGLPLLVQGKLIGILTLFNKLNGELFTSEDEQLLNVLGAQSAQVIMNARLAEKERALLKLEEEIKVAREIQNKLLPSSVPHIENLQIFGISEPAKAVGGDFFDYLHLPDNRLGILFGDVSGKGISAALLMSNLLAMFKTQAMLTISPGECMTRVNKILCHFTEGSRFASLFYGIIDPRSKNFVYSNAGHPPPIWLSGSEIKYLTPDETFMGIMDHVQYVDKFINLEKNDVICIYSDGILETKNNAGEQFGCKRVVNLLKKYKKQNPKIIWDKIYQALSKHGNVDQPNDDISAVIIKQL